MDRGNEGLLSWFIGLIALAIILGLLMAYAPIAPEWQQFLEKAWEILITILIAIGIISGIVIGVVLYWTR